MPDSILKELLKDEQRYSDLSSEWGRDILEKKNLELSIEKYKKYLVSLDVTRERIYEIRLNELAMRAVSMEDERNRLLDLIEVFKERISVRDSLKDEFNKILKSVDKEKDKFWENFIQQNPIKDVEKLSYYEDRLKAINIYIDRKTKAISLAEKINVDGIQLEKALEVQMEYEKINNQLEVELHTFFINDFDLSEYSIEADEQESITIHDLEALVLEKIKVQEGNFKAFNKKENSIQRSSEQKNKKKDESLKLKKELKKTKEEHFEIKEYMLVYSLNSLVSNNVSNYEEIKVKRLQIIDLLKERATLINKYNLKVEPSKFERMLVLVNNQLEEVLKQEENNKLIITLNKNINNNNEEIVRLNAANNEEKYAALASEFLSFGDDVKEDLEEDVIEFPKLENKDVTDEPKELTILEEEKTNDQVEPIVLQNGWEVEPLGDASELFDEETKENLGEIEFVSDNSSQDVVDEKNEEIVLEKIEEPLSLDQVVVEPDTNTIAQEDSLNQLEVLDNSSLEDVSLEENNEEKNDEITDEQLKEMVAQVVEKELGNSQSLGIKVVKVDETPLDEDKRKKHKSRAKGILRNVFASFKRNDVSIDKDGNVIERESEAKRRTLG